MKKVVFCVLSLMFCGSVFADGCLEYKISPKVSLDVPEWTVEIVQPKEVMNFWHGNVLATLVDNYELITDVKEVDGGYCVFLKKVKAQVGYSNFLIHVDARHAPNTCGYNAILKHEKKHLGAYLSVMDDMKAEVKEAIEDAADSVMPFFISYKDNISEEIDSMNLELRGHPNLILIKQKIQAAQEIRNKQIDVQENGADLSGCAK